MPAIRTASIGGVHKDAYEIDEAIDSYQRGFDGDPKSTYCLLNILCLLTIRDKTGDRLRSKRLLPIADNLTAEAMKSKGADYWTMYDRAYFFAFADSASNAKGLFVQAIEKTKSIGELRSARKNLDLLKDAGTNIAALPSILSLFDDAEAMLSVRET